MCWSLDFFEEYILLNLYFNLYLNLNFINDLTKLVSSQILAHVQLRVCQKY